MRSRILQMLAQRPFQPFRLYLTNGTVHLIRHPKQLWVGPSFVIVGVPNGESSQVQDIREALTISLLHIVSVEPFSLSTPTAN